MAANSEPNETESSGRPPRLIRIEVGSDLIAALVKSGRLTERDSNDHLAITLAVQRLVKDIVAGKFDRAS
jgi:hypothetical protein